MWLLVCGRVQLLELTKMKKDYHLDTGLLYLDWLPCMNEVLNLLNPGVPKVF